MAKFLNTRKLVSEIDDLIRNGFKVNIFDPMVDEKTIKSDLIFLWKRNSTNKNDIKKFFGKITVSKTADIAINNSKIIAILTEWDHFKSYNWIQSLKSKNSNIKIFDGQNILQSKNLSSRIRLYNIGKINEDV